MSDEPHRQGDESAAEDARLLDDTSRAELLELAKSYSEAQINRLQAVQTKSGTLAVFAVVVTGLLIGQDAAGTGPLGLGGGRAGRCRGARGRGGGWLRLVGLSMARPEVDRHLTGGI